MSYPERIVPDETEPGVVALHLKRYEFARPICAARDVLDAACGVGYGSAYLAEAARRVIGLDASAEALAYARRRYSHPSVEYVQGDLQELPFPAASFDVVCAFEAIEHLDEPERFLVRAADVLRDDGVLVASTPNVPETTRTPANPYHRIEVSPRDFERLLRRSFAHVALYGQRRLLTTRHRLAQRVDVLGLRRRVPALRRASTLTGSSATEDVRLDELEIAPDAFANATEIVAVCRK